MYNIRIAIQIRQLKLIGVDAGGHIMRRYRDTITAHISETFLLDQHNVPCPPHKSGKGIQWKRRLTTTNLPEGSVRVYVIAKEDYAHIHCWKLRPGSRHPRRSHPVRDACRGFDEVRVTCSAAVVQLLRLIQSQQMSCRISIILPVCHKIYTFLTMHGIKKILRLYPSLHFEQLRASQNLNLFDLLRPTFWFLSGPAHYGVKAIKQATKSTPRQKKEKKDDLNCRCGTGLCRFRSALKGCTRLRLTVSDTPAIR